MDSLEHMCAVTLAHLVPYVAEAAVVDGASRQHREDAAEHDGDLEDVGPHRRLHAALTTHEDEGEDTETGRGHRKTGRGEDGKHPTQRPEGVTLKDRLKRRRQTALSCLHTALRTRTTG